MTPIILRSLPLDSVLLFNSLYPEMKPEYLTDDLLAVRLRNGIVIDVSWRPEHDLDGEFVIATFDENGEETGIPPAKMGDPFSAAACVVNLAWQYSNYGGA